MSLHPIHETGCPPEVFARRLRDAPEPRIEPAGETAPERRELQRLGAFARLLDSSFEIPGTRFRIGIDPLIGLVPGIGDVAGAGLSLYLIARAWRLGVPRGVRARMLGNVALEALVGTVPLLGDAFDAWFKCNLRNLRLLETALRRRASPTPD